MIYACAQERLSAVVLALHWISAIIKSPNFNDVNSDTEVRILLSSIANLLKI